tara:strand:+ start:13765 stop:14847 length:1083 start_codon:yes stop_codon:yes gene_type:complete
MTKVLIVGPKKSQHIQKWYENAKDFELSLFTIDPGGREFKTDLNEYSYSIKNRRLAFLFSIPLFIYTWWKVKPNITNFHYLSSYALLSLFVPKKNLILNTWGSDVNNYINSKNTIHLYLIKKALKRFSWISTPAQHMKIKLIKLGADSDKIDVYQYGVPLLNGRKSGTTTCIKFVSNRNWDELYRIDIIIDAFVILVRQEEINAKLFIYGRGGDISKKLDFLFETSPELKEFIIVKGYVEHKLMLEEMRDMDIFVSVPKIDGMPLSLLEAMEIGLLPLVSNIDANNEWVNECNGIICKNVIAHELKCKMLQAYRKSECTSCESTAESDWVFKNRMLVREKGNFDKNTNLFLNKIKEISGE